MGDYKHISEERLREIIEDALYSKPPLDTKIEAFVCEDSRGWIPIEESKAFDRAMKQSIFNYIVGDKVKLQNLTVVDRHYYTIYKIEYDTFYLRRYTKSGEVNTKTTIENMIRYTP